MIFLPTTPGIEASWLPISVTPNLLVGRSVNLKIVLSSATVFFVLVWQWEKMFQFSRAKILSWLYSINVNKNVNSHLVIGKKVKNVFHTMGQWRIKKAGKINGNLLTAVHCSGLASLSQRARSIVRK